MAEIKKFFLDVENSMQGHKQTSQRILIQVLHQKLLQQVISFISLRQVK